MPHVAKENYLFKLWLYLVDNCSDGDDVKILKEKHSPFYDNLLEIKPKNLGFTGSNNFALNSLRDRKDTASFLFLFKFEKEDKFMFEKIKRRLKF